MLNAEDGGRRRGIVITNNEVDPKTTRRLHRDGHFVGDPEFEALGVYRRAAVPRINAAFTGRQAQSKKPLPGKYLNGELMSDGFGENVAFFNMAYVNPDSLEAGEQFDAIFPILWLAGGATGGAAFNLGDEPWLADSERSFSVLFDEDRFRDFAAHLRENPHITTVWLVTDSEAAFARMRSRLPESLRVGMLYRDYLRNCIAMHGAFRDEDPADGVPRRRGRRAGREVLPDAG
jgi:adenine-specific DNA-methyltransferase